MPKVKTQKKSRRSRQQEEVYTVERVVDKRLNGGRVSRFFKKLSNVSYIFALSWRSECSSYLTRWSIC